MNAEFKISVEFFDDDVVSVWCFGSNGVFAGGISAYGPPNLASQLARAITGFPIDATDRREFEFGSFDPEFAGGGARLQLACLDQVGHAELRLELRADPQLRGRETAVFSIPIEAA